MPFVNDEARSAEPVRYSAPTPEEIQRYVREGERLRAEAILSFWQGVFSAIRRSYATVKDAVLINTINPGRHA